MLRKQIIAPLVLMIFSFSVPAVAGMNHQPHNTKKFMGGVKKEVKIKDQQFKTDHDQKVRKNPHRKGVQRVRR